MPRSTKCRFGGRTITVEKALRLRKAGHKDFICLGCPQRVSPHSQSTPGKQFHAAHFEHPKDDGGRNRHCQFSDGR